MKRLASVVLLLVLGVWAANTSLFVAGVDQHQTRVIAHRGVHHIYTGSDKSGDACHASPVEPIEHAFIENTIPSMQEAFRLGADVVEIDIHLTPDDVFAVFHDWTVDCRTNGAGVTHEQSLAALQALDIGYGLDDGTGTYPMRGKSIGAIPSLDQVFAEAMDGQFLINFKSRRRKEGVALAQMLQRPEMRGQVYGVYGGQRPTRETLEAVPDLRGFDKAGLQDCLVRYLALGWSSYVPESCRNTIVMVPQNYASFMWGWPHRFTRRLEAVGTDVILAGAYDGSGFSSGIDDADSFAKVPDAFDGYVWTNRIELIGPLNEARQ
ncbi:glycerophosphoryl diester phosphodiesterase [Tateyamaria omphalii]|nr:glycerophosphoryl diester phosphodiesterase [Tateyamaria omphalii]